MLFVLNFLSILGPEYLDQMWAYICPELLSSIEREPEESVVPEMMESFSKVKPLSFILLCVIKVCQRRFFVDNRQKKLN